MENLRDTMQFDMDIGSASWNRGIFNAPGEVVVVASDGFSYELEYLRRAVATNGRSPLTREPLRGMAYGAGGPYDLPYEPSETITVVLDPSERLAGKPSMGLAARLGIYDRPLVTIVVELDAECRPIRLPVDAGEEALLSGLQRDLGIRSEYLWLQGARVNGKMVHAMDLSPGRL